mgnify:FL=1|jgi:type I restriction enzyme, S subunit
MHSKIKSSQLAKRFDVRFHFSEEDDFESWALEELKDTIVRDPNCYGFKYSRVGIPIIRISDMKQPFVDFSRVAYISDEVHNTFKKTQLLPFDILISVRGMSTGKVSIFLGEFAQANISPNIIIVRLKDTSLSCYVAMILISEVGQKQIKRFFSGGGKPSLTAPMVNQIQIPKPTKEKLNQINKLFDEAIKKRKDGDNILEKINSIFFREFEGFKIEKTIVSTRRKSDLRERWDPHYHNEGFRKLRKFLSKRSESSKQIEHYGKEATAFTEEIDNKKVVEYIEIGSINNLTGIIDDSVIDYPEKLPKSSKALVGYGDVLISKVRPYLNSNSIVLNESESLISFASKNGFAIFRTSATNYKYYIAAFIRNELGLAQIEMYQSGTSYPTVSSDDIKKLRILEISTDNMDTINSLYEDYVGIKTIEEFSTKAILEIIEDEEI